MSKPDCTCAFRLAGLDDDQHQDACAVSIWQRGRAILADIRRSLEQQRKPAEKTERRDTPEELEARREKLERALDRVTKRTGGGEGQG